MSKRNNTNQQFKDYINIPLSIVDQKWFMSDEAVRAWFFYAWKAITPQVYKTKGKRVKEKTFNLTQGETICTRTYLAKALNINMSSAKCSTDKLRRSGAINVNLESLSEGKNAWRWISRITVNGVPVPNEPYLKMDFPLDKEMFWTKPTIARIYVYMMCNAYHKDTCIIGTGYQPLYVGAGDMVLSYKKIESELECKEWELKNCLRLLESCGAISRVRRVGNSGVLIHLNLYHLAKQQSKTNDVENKMKDVLTELPKTEPSPTPSVNPVTVKKSTAKSSDQADKKILDTPVTEGIKYLFFDKKKNKDIDRLNDIISYVNENIPTDFPVEQLKAAMDYYFKEYGDEYIDCKKLVKTIVEFKGVLDNKSITAINGNEKRIVELNRKIAQEGDEYKAFGANWEVIGENFKRYMEKEDWINVLSPDTIYSMYHTLWCANLTGNFIERKLLERKANIDSPSSWDAETCKWANYVVRFFECIDNIDEFENICLADRHSRYDEYIRKWKEYNDELEQLKKAI